jgi:hypothetical protein
VLEIIGTGKREFGEFHCKPERPGKLFQNPDAFWNDLSANAIARN